MEAACIQCNLNQAQTNARNMKFCGREKSCKFCELSKAIFVQLSGRFKLVSTGARACTGDACVQRSTNQTQTNARNMKLCGREKSCKFCELGKVAFVRLSRRFKLLSTGAGACIEDACVQRSTNQTQRNAGNMKFCGREKSCKFCELSPAASM